METLAAGCVLSVGAAVLSNTYVYLYHGVSCTKLKYSKIINFSYLKFLTLSANTHLTPMEYKYIKMYKHWREDNK